MSEVSSFLSNLPAFDQMVQAQTEIVQQAEAEAEAEAVDAAFRQSKLQCCVDAAYLIASADGATTNEELSHLCDKVCSAVDGALSADQVNAMIDVARSKVDAGRDDTVAQIAATIEDPEERETAFTVAAAVSWTGGGIGAKEGLALQAISGAFGWEMSHMHKVLGKARG